jgi:hypothetical protein
MCNLKMSMRLCREHMLASPHSSCCTCHSLLELEQAAVSTLHVSYSRAARGACAAALPAAAAAVPLYTLFCAPITCIMHCRLPVKSNSDRDALLALVAEVVVESHSVLVFCAGRAAAQSCASMLATELGRLVGQPSPSQAAARQELVEELRVALAGAVNADLERMIGEQQPAVPASRPPAATQ